LAADKSTAEVFLIRMGETGKGRMRINSYKELRVLIIEDVPSDAELNERAIQEVLTPCVFKRVENEEDFLRALDEFKPDIIISDYKMPGFDGITALKLTLEKTPLTPFIIVTGSVNEDTAVDCMKAGATDYVVKEHLKRLGPAVVRALEEKKICMERLRAEEALKQSEGKYRTLVENIPQKIFTKDRRSVYVSCNELLARDLGITPEEFAGKTDYDFFPKGLADKYRSDDMRIMESGETEGIEEQYIQSGEKVWVYTIKTPLRDKDGNTVGILGIFSDITERKKMEGELKKRIKELEDFYDMSVSRELKMIELKKEIEGLKEALEKFKKG